MIRALQHSSSAPERWCAQAQRGAHLSAMLALLVVYSADYLNAHSFFSSEELAKLAARKYARIVQKLGFAVRCLQYSYC